MKLEAEVKRQSEVIDKMSKTIHLLKKQRDAAIKMSGKEGQFPVFDIRENNLRASMMQTFGSELEKDLPEGAQIVLSWNDDIVVLKNGKFRQATVEDLED